MIDSVKWLNALIRLCSSDPYRFSATVALTPLLAWALLQLIDRCVAFRVSMAFMYRMRCSGVRVVESENDSDRWPFALRKDHVVLQGQPSHAPVRSAR